jgi:hypothetical protein
MSGIWLNRAKEKGGGAEAPPPFDLAIRDRP